MKNKSRLLREEDVIRTVDKHTNDGGTLDNDISCILEEVKDASNVVSWVSVEDRLPVVTLEKEYPSIFVSDLVLIQTRKGEMFVAIRQLKMWESKVYKDEDDWYSFGTGGRKMKVKSKVVAWMPLPKPYEERE